MSLRISTRLLRITAIAVIIAIAALAIPQIIIKSADLLSYFPILGWIEIGAESFVAIGCFAELILLFLKEPNEHNEEEKRIRRNWERIWMAMVAIGVAAGVPCLMIGLRESAQMNEDAAVARKEAALASKQSASALWQASLANERTALVESTNLVLRSNVVSLEMKVQPRTITMQQVTNFIFLTQNITKIPITISLGKEGFDTETFASQIREMFSKAGFGIKRDGPFGVMRDDTRLFAAGIDRPRADVDVVIIVPSDEIFERMKTNSWTSITINGITRPLVTSTNEEEIFAGIQSALAQNRISSAFWTSQWSGPREFEIFIPIKNQF